jgi:hypothetical protein
MKRIFRLSYAAKHAEGKGEQSIIFLPDKPTTEAGVKSSRTWSIYHLQPVPYLNWKTFEDLPRICCCLFLPRDYIHNADLSWEERDVSRDTL